MRVVAVVLNWRRPMETVACVASLAETAPDLDVIVVDNASFDGSAETIQGELPGVRFLQNPVNAGYAGGNNLGIVEALRMDADAVLVLNNDLIVRPGCVRELVEALARHPEWGIAAPLSLRQDDPGVVDFFTCAVDLANCALMPQGRDERATFTEDAETDYATGSALLISRTVLERAGLLDERFFLVWEDVDLCLRARKAGLRTGATPRAQVLHGRSVSFGGEGSPLYWYFLVRNSFLIARKHLRAPRRWRTRRMIARRYPIWAQRSRPEVARAITLGLAHGIGGRFGPPPPELAGSAVAAP